MENIENGNSERNQNVEEPEVDAAVTKTGFTRRQWILLIFFCLLNLFSSMTFSIQAPFYPAEAEKKGATASEYGLVFGTVEFVIFVAAPIFGQFINKIGPKTLFTTSIFLNAVSIICFGLLDNVNDHYWFIGLSFLCRFIEGLGMAGILTTIFVYVACEFTTSVATTFASLETFMGLGFIVGPTLGSAMFSLGGFPMPFFTVGVGLLVLGLGSLLVLPRKETATGEDGKEQKGIGIFTILKIPEVFLAALSIVSSASSMGYVTATLEPHIRQFGLTPFQTGLMFILNGGVYAFMAPLFGKICDRIAKPEYITVLGNLVICLAFMLIGPASFMPLDTTLWITIVGLALQGVGFGCCYVSTFIVGLKYCIANGHPDDVTTYGVVSGMWQSMISLGAWIGPSAGGALYDAVGFRQGSWMILGLCFVAGISILIHAWIKSATDGTESEPLLESLRQLAAVSGPMRKRSESLYGAT